MALSVLSLLTLLTLIPEFAQYVCSRTCALPAFVSWYLRLASAYFTCGSVDLWSARRCPWCWPLISQRWPLAIKAAKRKMTAIY